MITFSVTKILNNQSPSVKNIFNTIPCRISQLTTIPHQITAAISSLTKIPKKIIYTKSNQNLEKTCQIFKILLHSANSESVKTSKVTAHLNKILKDKEIILTMEERKILIHAILQFRNQGIILSDTPLLKKILAIIEKKLYCAMPCPQRMWTCYREFVTGKLDTPYQINEKNLSEMNLFSLSTTVPQTPKASVTPIVLFTPPSIPLKESPALLEKEFSKFESTAISVAVSSIICNNILGMEVSLSELIILVNTARDPNCSSIEKADLKAVLLSKVDSLIKKIIIHILFFIIYYVASFYICNVTKVIKNTICHIEGKSRQELESILHHVINECYVVLQAVATNDLATLHQYIESIALLITTTNKHGKQSLQYYTNLKITRFLVNIFLPDIIKNVSQLDDNSVEILKTKEKQENSLHQKIQSLLNKLGDISSNKCSNLTKNIVKSSISTILESTLAFALLTTMPPAMPLAVKITSRFFSAELQPEIESLIEPCLEGSDRLLAQGAKLFLSKGVVEKLIEELFIATRKNHLQYDVAVSLKKANDLSVVRSLDELNQYAKERVKEIEAVGIQYLMRMQTAQTFNHYTECVIEEIQQAVTDYLQDSSNKYFTDFQTEIEGLLSTSDSSDSETSHHLATIRHSFRDCLKENKNLGEWAESLNFFTPSFSFLSQIKALGQVVAGILPLNVINADIMNKIKTTLIA